MKSPAFFPSNDSASISSLPSYNGIIRDEALVASPSVNHAINQNIARMEWLLRHVKQLPVINNAHIKQHVHCIRQQMVLRPAELTTDHVLQLIVCVGETDRAAWQRSLMKTIAQGLPVLEKNQCLTEGNCDSLEKALSNLKLSEQALPPGIKMRFRNFAKDCAAVGAASAGGIVDVGVVPATITAGVAGFAAGVAFIPFKACVSCVDPSFGNPLCIPFSWAFDAGAAVTMKCWEVPGRSVLSSAYQMFHPAPEERHKPSLSRQELQLREKMQLIGEQLRCSALQEQQNN